MLAQTDIMANTSANDGIIKRKRGRPRKKTVEDQVVEELGKRLFYSKCALSDLDSKNNKALATIRVKKITANMLDIWIRRFIFLSNKGDFFGISTEEKEIVVWFNFEDEAIKCDLLFDDIRKHGVPNHSNWTV